MTARQIQESLYTWLLAKGHRLVVPNTHALGWEADLVSLTKAGLANEYEIKLTRADYRADAKKTAKHKALRTGQHAANYFWYVTPPGLDVDPLPKHAGHIEVGQDDAWVDCRVVKRAPRLHARALDRRGLERLAVSLMYTAWKGGRA